jgi:chromatin assembly factor 1 subunit A
MTDTLYPINPFTYVAPQHEEGSRASSDSRFVVPPLPNHVSSSKLSEVSSSDAMIAPTATKKSLVPKQTFPDALLPALLTRITALRTGSLVLIVEAVYQELKDQKVKKKSIEAKVREVAAKENKIWVVKAGLQVSSRGFIQLGALTRLEIDRLAKCLLRIMNIDLASNLTMDSLPSFPCPHD